MRRLPSAMRSRAVAASGTVASGSPSETSKMPSVAASSATREVPGSPSRGPALRCAAGQDPRWRCRTRAAGIAVTRSRTQRKAAIVSSRAVSRRRGSTFAASAGVIAGATVTVGPARRSASMKRCCCGLSSTKPRSKSSLAGIDGHIHHAAALHAIFIAHGASREKHHPEIAVIAGIGINDAADCSVFSGDFGLDAAP